MDSESIGLSRSRIRRSASVLALALALVAGGIPAQPASAAVFKVKAKKGDRWGPKHTYIGKGDKVVFKNPMSRIHDFTSTKGPWAKSVSKVLNKGDKVTVKFGKTGTYQYRCLRHSAIVGKKCQGMCGFVHVFTK